RGVAHERAEGGRGARAGGSSAGTEPWHAGQPADGRAVDVLRRHGYPTRHVARQVDVDHLEADLLLASTAEHRAALTRVLGREDAARRVRLLRSFDPSAPAGAELPHPYYGDRGFDEGLEMVEAAQPRSLAGTRERLDG